MYIFDCIGSRLDIMCLGNAESIRLLPMPLSLRYYRLDDKYWDNKICNWLSI